MRKTTTIELKDKKTITEITDEKILFSNGDALEYVHDQDCCERVYADFKALKDTAAEDHEFTKIAIENVAGSGFRLNGFFVPCYNKQNGYYSSNLALIYREHKTNTETKINIDDCVKDVIK